MSFEDYEARAAARDQAPPEFAGVDPAAVAEWAVHGGSTPAQNAIATKVNPIIESVQADEEAAQTPEWEADSTYFDESGAGVPELDPYSPTFAEDVKGYTEQQIAAALQPYAGDAEVEAWYADYQQRQQAWREEAAQAQWQGTSGYLTPPASTALTNTTRSRHSRAARSARTWPRVTRRSEKV
jgi:hypothetical protein